MYKRDTAPLVVIWPFANTTGEVKSLRLCCPPIYLDWRLLWRWNSNISRLLPVPFSTTELYLWTMSCLIHRLVPSMLVCCYSISFNLLKRLTLCAGVMYSFWNWSLQTASYDLLHFTQYITYNASYLFRICTNSFICCLDHSKQSQGTPCFFFVFLGLCGYDLARMDARSLHQ